MNELDILNEVIETERTVRLVEEDIYSVLPGVQQTFQYDKKAAIYDFVVGSSLFNRLMWGDSPNNYIGFACRAINSHPNGWLNRCRLRLDAFHGRGLSREPPAHHCL